MRKRLMLGYSGRRVLHLSVAERSVVYLVLPIQRWRQCGAQVLKNECIEDTECGEGRIRTLCYVPSCFRSDRTPFASGAIAFNLGRMLSHKGMDMFQRG